MNIEDLKTCVAISVAITENHLSTTSEVRGADEIFLMVFAGQRKLKAKTKAAYEPRPRPSEPAWFPGALEAMKGKRVQATELAAYVTDKPTQAEATDCARWLRKRGYVPTRTGGKTIFQL